MPKILHSSPGPDSPESETTSKLEAFAAALTDLTNITARSSGQIWAAVETGAQLRGLASITAESVAKLYEFRRGLAAVGGSTWDLPAIFARTREVLSGLDERHGRTKEAFALMGLKPEQLRAADTADAVLQIARALGKMDPNTAQGVADQLYTNYQAENLLAISRNLELFQREMRDSSQTGEALERFSKLFENLETSRATINNDALGIHAAMAGSIAPQVQEIFGEIHDDMKHILLALSIAAQSGHLTNLPPEAINGFLDNLKLDSTKLMAILEPDSGVGVPPAATTSRNENKYRPEFTPLEKMGFIMSGTKVQNPMEQRKMDLLQQIAHNTAAPNHAAPPTSPLSHMGDYPNQPRHSKYSMKTKLVKRHQPLINPKSTLVNSNQL